MPRTDPSPSQSQPERLIEVGRVLKAHGLHGDMRIEDLSDNPARFTPGQRLLIGGSAYQVQGSKRAGATRLLKLQGVDSPEALRPLLGAAIEVPESEAPPLRKGAYYHFQLIGLRVVSSAGEELGTLAEVHATGANDVYLVRGPNGDVLLPAISGVVLKVDLNAGTVTVEKVAGLF